MASLSSNCSKSTCLSGDEETNVQFVPIAVTSLLVLQKEYSNTPPKVKKISSKQFCPDEYQIWIEEERKRSNITFEKALKIIENSGYFLVPGAIIVINGTFGHLYTKEKEVLVVLSYYNKKSCRLILKRIDEDDESGINDLSWNHLSKALNSKMNPRRPRDRLQPIRRPSGQDLSVLYTINHFGTIKFIKRLVLMTNPKGSYNFYAVYDNRKELDQLKKTIKKFNLV